MPTSSIPGNPTITAVTDDGLFYSPGETAVFTVFFSETVTGVSIASFTVTNGVIAAVTPVLTADDGTAYADGTVYTLTVTQGFGPLDLKLATTNGIKDLEQKTLVADGSVLHTIYPVTVDPNPLPDAPPQVVLVTDDVAGNAAPHQTIQFTVTFDQYTVGASLASFSVTHGTLQTVTPVENSKTVLVTVQAAASGTVTLSVNTNNGILSEAYGVEALAADLAEQPIDPNLSLANHPPAGTDKTLSLLEDANYALKITDFGFTDANDSPAHSLLAVKISTLPTTGSLTLNGVAVTAGQFVAATDITKGLLKFAPATNAYGTKLDSFTFQVQDNGGTNFGGSDLDPTANTLSFTVNSVNDAPAGTDVSLSLLEDTGYPLKTSDFGCTDPKDTPANSLLAVKITTLPTLGNLMLNGVAVTAGQSVTAADITAGRLQFVPTANATGSASFTFQVRDNGGTANGGADLDATPNTFNINLTPVNDAPAGINKAIALNEDSTYSLKTSDFGFTDANDTPANNLLAVKITTLPTAGSLTLKGVAVTAGQTIAASDIMAGLLKFVPTANAIGSASFMFQVQDNGGTASGGIDLDGSPNKIAFNIASINDAPAGTDQTLDIPDELAYALNIADFGFTDPKDIPANTLLAVKIASLPAAGILTLNGAAVTVGQSIAATDITAGLLRFTPAANATGTNYASFTFQVRDDGGTLKGGIDLDPSANRVSFNVTARDDLLIGTELKDALFGRGGNDTLIGLGGDDLLDGGSGDDIMVGGKGNDTYTVTSSADVIVEQTGEGTDSVQALMSCALPANVENLTLTGLAAIDGTGNSLNNILLGNAANNRLNGGDGADLLKGQGGADTLSGGAGADRFAYADIADSLPNARDSILDFSAAQADRIDVSAIDANTLLAGNQAFAFIGSLAFSASGQARFEAGVLQLNVDSQLAADAEIALVGVTSLAAAQLIL